MIRIPVHIDYGAEQYYWYAPFQTGQEVCNWWLAQTDLDLYSKITTHPEEVLIGTVSAVSKNQLDAFEQEFTKSPITVHLDNDYNSYLIINRMIYFHQGFKGKKWTINHKEAQPVLRFFDDSDN